MKTPFPIALVILAVAIGAVASVAAAQDQAPFPADPGLQDYLEWSQDHNPAVARASGRVAALEHGAHGAGALPDLRFGWGEMIVPVETRVGP